MIANCNYCGNLKDVRPYGEKGKLICFHCAFSSEERKQQVESNFLNQLNNCGYVAVIDKAGLGPIIHKKYSNKRLN